MFIKAVIKQSLIAAILAAATFNAQAAIYSNSTFSIETAAENAELVGDVFTVNYGYVLRDAYQGVRQLNYRTPFTLSINEGWVVNEIWITLNFSYDLVMDWTAAWPGGHREVWFRAITSMAPYGGAGNGGGIYGGPNSNPTSPRSSAWGSAYDIEKWFAAPGQELEGVHDLAILSRLYLYTYVGFGQGTLDSVSLRFVTAPVPEPSTYAMLGLGLGVLGFAARRRQSA